MQLESMKANIQLLQELEHRCMELAIHFVNNAWKVAIIGKAQLLIFDKVPGGALLSPSLVFPNEKHKIQKWCYES